MEPAPSSSSDAPSSRNNLFFQTIHVPSPPKAKPPLRLDKKQAGPPRQPSSLAAARRGHAKRPSFGRISMEQRESERERIRADHSVDIRVLLERVIVNRPHPWGLLYTFARLLRARSVPLPQAPPEIHAILEHISHLLADRPAQAAA